MPTTTTAELPPWYKRVRDSNRLFLILQLWLGPEYRDNASLPQIIVEPNPHSFNLAGRQTDHKTQMYNGFYEECWGEGAGNISCSGQTRGFFLPSTGYVGDDDRFQTQSYTDYQVLCEVFKNNGVVFAPDGSVFHQGDVVLNYGKFFYTGKFLDFRTEFTKPYNYDLNFSFEYRKRSL